MGHGSEVEGAGRARLSKLPFMVALTSSHRAMGISQQLVATFFSMLLTDHDRMSRAVQAISKIRGYMDHMDC